MSFPADPPYLGDILVCVDKAQENAASAGYSINRELQILLLHGVLHLLGYDHEKDHGEMDALEEKLRKRLITNRQLIQHS